MNRNEQIPALFMSFHCLIQTLLLPLALPDEQLQQGGIRPGPPATGRRLRQGKLQVPGSHPAQVRQVGGQDRPAHGQKVNPYSTILRSYSTILRFIYIKKTKKPSMTFTLSLQICVPWPV